MSLLARLRGRTGWSVAEARAASVGAMSRMVVGRRRDFNTMPVADAPIGGAVSDGAVGGTGRLTDSRLALGDALFP